MDTSGRIHWHDHEIPENQMPLSNVQARELSKLPYRKRKNWMRNQPCVCGSGKKFKKCCWAKMAVNSQISCINQVNEKK